MKTVGAILGSLLMLVVPAQAKRFEADNGAAIVVNDSAIKVIGSGNQKMATATIGFFPTGRGVYMPIMAGFMCARGMVRMTPFSQFGVSAGDLMFAPPRSILGEALAWACRDKPTTSHK